jgi:hypothetical protein
MDAEADNVKIGQETQQNPPLDAFVDDVVACSSR